MRTAVWPSRVCAMRMLSRSCFSDLGPRFKARPGGYTRILRMLPRAGDSAPMALMQLVDGPAAVGAEEAPAAKKTSRRAKKAEAAGTEAQAAPKASRKKKAAAA